MQTAKNVARTEIIVPARVVDVILDDSHPEFERYGKWASIGAVKYRVLNRDIDESNSQNLPIAFPLQSHIKHIPLKNEIILVVSSPSELLDESSNNVKNYYLDIVNLWNHPHHNGFPDDTDQDIELGEDFQELADVNPMRPFEGDVIFEGRQGQSLRFSTGIPNKTPWVGEQGSPITVLSNGQITTDEGFTTITEDVNEDFSSIYLTSNQQVKLTPSQTFSLFSPQGVDLYEQSQFLANSNRVVLNGRDSIIVTAANQIGLKATDMYLEGTSNVTINAPRIQLGEKNTQPILKGDDTVKLLKDLLSELQNLGTKMLAAANAGGPIIPVQDAGASLVTKTTTLTTRLEKLKSTKTYTE
tara:strand:+ start:5813 stop:6883 length:1071 start_codon:yes stop_codon:yes gene_type:complete